MVNKNFPVGYAANFRRFCPFCIYDAKVQIFPELAKFCARRMQLKLFKTAEQQPKFSEAKLFSNYFAGKMQSMQLFIY